jgi:hypothetical protein
MAVKIARDLSIAHEMDAYPDAPRPAPFYA